MDFIKKILGLVWIALGIFSVYYLFVNQAMVMWQKGGENIIPAVIYTFILCPIIAGSLGIFGYYCFKGEFDKKK